MKGFVGIPEKIKRIEEDLARTQVNKKTEHHVGILKAKLAKLRRDQEEARSRGSGSSLGYDIKRTGDACAVLVGLPNVGKSSLLNSLTNSRSRVAAYQFTTLEVVPGLLEYRGARIQMLDLPGIISGASAGRGLGRRVLSVARSADLVIFVIDVFQPHALTILQRELKEIGIRPDERPPDVLIEKTSTGGIAVHSSGKLRISVDLVMDILREYGYMNARVVIREDITAEQLIDVLDGNRTYVPSIVVMNKVDLVNSAYIDDLKSQVNFQFIPVSAEGRLNLDELRDRLYEKLNLIRVYMRPKGSEADLVEPLIIPRGAQVLDVCNKLHRQIRQDFRYAQVWGRSVKFGGQRVGLGHHLMDEDVLTLITS